MVRVRQRTRSSARRSCPESASTTISPSARSRSSSTARSAHAAPRCSRPTRTRPKPPVISHRKNPDLQPMFEEALRKGVQIETHAIGDRANRVILDLYEKAMKVGAIRATKNSRATLARRACADSKRGRSSSLRQTRRDRIDATVARDQRFVFRPKPAREGTARRRLCLAKPAEIRRRSSAAAPMRLSSAANR